MTDTLPNITLPSNQWVDLYLATGISARQPMEVENIGSTDVYLTVSANQPNDDGPHTVLARGERQFNQKNDSGAWAISRSSNGLLNARAL